MKFVGKCLLIEDEERVLVVGDMHLGMEESLNNTGILVTRKMFEETLEYFDSVFEKIGGKVDRVVFLGDLKNSFSGINRQEWSDVLKLFDYLEDKCGEIIVIQGNHDNYIKNIAGKRNIRVEDYYIWKEYAFVHGDKDFEALWYPDIEYLIMGHAHPAIVLEEGAKSEKYKCFLEGVYKKKKVIIVPSFVEFVAGSDPREVDFKLAWNIDFNKFKVRIVGENTDVLDFGLLKDLD